MKMLRDFAVNPDSALLAGVLERFGFDLSGHRPPVEVLRFEVITPDSFMWRLRMAGSAYYLYAEDYIPGLDHVKSVFNDYIEQDKWVFVKAKHPKSFESTSP